MTSSLSSSRRLSGFNSTDLFAILAVLSVLGAGITIPLVKSNRRARMEVCTSNLGEISKAILKYTEDNKKGLPGSGTNDTHDVWWWYKEDVKKYAGLSGESSAADKTFSCPDDRGYSESKPFWKSAKFDYSSYVFNGVNLPGIPNISGLQLASINKPERTLLALEFCAHAPLSWHASKTGKENSPFYSDAQSVVAFVDGHVSFSKIYYDGYNASYTRDPIPGYDYKFSPK